MKVTNIRFNLKFFNADGGEEVVRTFADLRAKFNLSDLCEYFKSGDLAQWLRSINEPQVADKVDSLKGAPNRGEMLITLCEVLGLPIDKTETIRFCDVLDRQDKIQVAHKNDQNTRPKASEEAVSCNGDDKPSYIECVSPVLVSSDMQTARDAVRRVMRWYSDRFIEDLVKQHNITQSGLPLWHFEIGFFAWCALLGCKRWSPLLNAIGFHFQFFPEVRDIRVYYLNSSLGPLTTSRGVGYMPEKCDDGFYDCISWEP